MIRRCTPYDRRAVKRVVALADSPGNATVTVISDAARVFAADAVDSAEALRIAATDPGINPEAREALLKIVDVHLRQVQEKALKLRANAPVAELRRRGDTIASEFARGPLLAWRRGNPQATGIIERWRNQLIFIWMVLSSDRNRLVEAMIQAGLPQERRVKAVKIVEDSYQSLAPLKQSLEQRARQIGTIADPQRRELAQAVLEVEARARMIDVGAPLLHALHNLLLPNQIEALDRVFPKPGW